MSAKFHVDAVFSIQGRGTVLQGTIVTGEISGGMHVRVPGAQASRRVNAVEPIHGHRIPLGSLGLILDSSGPDDTKELARVSEGKVLDVE
jgi:GTPase